MHECPECGQMCCCNGDIDDCCHNFDDDVEACIHSQIDPQCCGHDDYEDDLYYPVGDADDYEEDDIDKEQADDGREGER